MNNYDNIIFKANTTYRTPQVGSLLIAQPYLDDRSFRHSVVLLTEKDSDGAFSGFVMNKLSQYTLLDFLEIDSDCNMPLYCGGPVSTDHLFFIHTLHDIIEGGVNIADNLYFGGNFEQLVSYMKSGFKFEGRLRFFLGYSGWGEHQLDEEIKENFWAIEKRYDPALLFGQGEDSYWHRHVRLLGKDFRSWRYHPLNPQSN